MHGDDRVRTCAACNREVIDVSALTRSEAEALAHRREAGERICTLVRVRVSDGAIRLADGYALPSEMQGTFGAGAVTTALVAAGAAVALACTPTPSQGHGPDANVALDASPSTVAPASTALAAGVESASTDAASPEAGARAAMSSAPVPCASVAPAPSVVPRRSTAARPVAMAPKKLEQVDAGYR
jgi:hypothetical protein